MEFVFVFCVFLITACALDVPYDLNTFDEPKRTCELIFVEMCKGELAYNYTGEPNLLNGEFYTQQDSLVLLMTFQPLINHGCSKQLKPFLCATYVPMCDPQVEQLIGPCRPVCENVKRRCQPILRTIGISWPPALNCSVFPEDNNGQTLCMDIPEEDEPVKDVTKTSPAPTRIAKSFSSKTADEEVETLDEIICAGKRNPSAYRYSNATGECRVKCDADHLFNTSEKQFTEVWMAVWTSFCFLFSVLTVITFFIDTAKFKYPKRPIIFLSLSYAIYSIAYLIRLIAGRSSVTCNSDRLMAQELENANCAGVFLLLYYFSMAAAIWWVILSLTWLLYAGLKWSHDAIELYSSYFHPVAWGMPAVLSIIIIVLRDISSEEITGLCFVGNKNPLIFLGFVIVPFSLFLLVGICLLMTGYILLFRQKKKQAMKCDEKIEALMVRIGIFAILYTVPATCLLACYFYEYTNLHSWYDNSLTQTPSIEIYILKIFSGLLPGVTSGLCVLGCNSLDIWANACSNIWARKYSRSASKASCQSNNNNNTTRNYMPVKITAVRQASSSLSHHSSGRSHSKHRHHHSSRSCAPSLQYPGEYHV